MLALGRFDLSCRENGGVMRCGLVRRLTVLAFLTASWSCTRLPEVEAARHTGPMPTEALPDSVTVPSAWGSLVSVTINPDYADVTYLWYQDAQGNVRIVVFDNRKRELTRKAFLIARR